MPRSGVHQRWRGALATQTWGQFDYLFAGYADAEQAFITALGTLVFPEWMQADLQEVLTTAETERAIALPLSTTQSDTYFIVGELGQDFLTAWIAAGTACDQLGHDLGLPPLQGATMPLVAAPAPTPGPAPTSETPTSGWNDTAYLTANAYAATVNETYGVEIPNAEFDAGEKLFGIYCQQQDVAERGACMVAEAHSIADPMRSAASGHLTWMRKHPAAHCFADAYAADTTVTEAYLKAANYLESSLTAQTDQERTDDDNGWNTWVAKADALLASFNKHWSGYFSDCQ